MTVLVAKWDISPNCSVMFLSTHLINQAKMSHHLISPPMSTEAGSSAELIESVSAC